MKFTNITKLYNARNPWRVSELAKKRNWEHYDIPYTMVAEGLGVFDFIWFASRENTTLKFSGISNFIDRFILELCTDIVDEYTLNIFKVFTLDKCMSNLIKLEKARLRNGVTHQVNSMIFFYIKGDYGNVLNSIQCTKGSDFENKMILALPMLLEMLLLEDTHITNPSDICASKEEVEFLIQLISDNRFMCIDLNK